jgi:hypothetical protein
MTVKYHIVYNVVIFVELKVFVGLYNMLHEILKY